jgi:hypothetical protein
MGWLLYRGKDDPADKKLVACTDTVLLTNTNCQAGEIAVHRPNEEGVICRLEDLKQFDTIREAFAAPTSCSGCVPS